MSVIVRIIKTFKTDIDTLFDLWTKPEHLKAWHRPDALLFTTPDASVDLRVGGVFEIVMKGPDGTHAVGGTFTEIDRPHKLSFTWRWVGSAEVSQVHITLRSVSDGTELTLIHVHPDESKLAKGHEEGWNGCLGVLEALINKER